MIDGTSIMRTTVASTSTANASPRPNILISGEKFKTNAPNTKIMMSAADVITRISATMMDDQAKHYVDRSVLRLKGAARVVARGRS